MMIHLCLLLLLDTTTTSRGYMGVQPEPELCPVGSYRIAGVTVGECQLCPRGTYGATTGLVTSRCTDLCPKGTYQDQLGATSLRDCRDCPEGVVGESRGLTSHQCSRPCPLGTYSNEVRLTRTQDCHPCPANYRGSQSLRCGDHDSAHACDTYWAWIERTKDFVIQTGKDELRYQTFLDV